LPAPAEINELAGADSRFIEGRQQAESRQLLHRMRQEIDADAQFAQLLRLLEDLDIDAGPVEGQRRHQTTNAAADDQELHRLSLVGDRPRRASHKSILGSPSISSYRTVRLEVRGTMRNPKLPSVLAANTFLECSEICRQSMQKEEAMAASPLRSMAPGEPS